MLFFRHKTNHERSIKQIGAAAVVVGGGLISGIMGASAASSAASTQAAAQQQAAGVSSAAQIQAAQIAANAQTQASQLQAQTTAATNAQNLGIYNQNIGMQQPWVQAGQGALAQQQAFMAGSGGAQPTLADMTGAMNPMYQFQVDQGNQALQASAAARGGLLTGQGAKDISNYNINAAGAGLQQGYNNYVNNQNNIYNRLAGMSATGQQAAGQAGTSGTNMAGIMSNTAMSGVQQQNALSVGAGQSLAAGTAGAGLAQAQGIAGVGAAQSAGIINANNAWTGAINQGMNTGLGMYGAAGGFQAGGIPGGLGNALFGQTAAATPGQAVSAGLPGATTSIPGMITPTY